MNDNKNKTSLGELLYAVCMSARDIVSEIKNLRQKDLALKQDDINLATSGVVVCTMCGAPFEENTSVCKYCGYISEERDRMLEKIRREKRSVSLQIEDEQHQLKKLLFIPIIIAIPFFLGVGAFLMIQLIGFLIMSLNLFF